MNRWDNFKFTDINGDSINAATSQNQQATSNSVLVYCPGWGQNLDLLKTSLADLVPLVSKIYTFEYNRKIYVNNLADINHYKTSAIINLIRHLDLTGINLMAHSEGSIYATLAAELCSDKINSLTLINPAGIVSCNTPQAVFGIAKQQLINYKKAMSSVEFRRKVKVRNNVAVDFIKANPKLAYLEVLNSIKSPLLLENLDRLNQSAINVAVVGAKNDLIYPGNVMVKKLEDMHVKSYLTNGWHDDINFTLEHYLPIFADILAATNPKIN